MHIICSMELQLKIQFAVYWERLTYCQSAGCGPLLGTGPLWNLVHQVRDYERAAGSMQPAFSLWLCLGQAHACSGSA